MSGRITINPKVVAALKEMRDQLRFDDHVDLEAFRASFRVLDQAGVFEDVDRFNRLHGWLPLPDGVTGTQIRHRKTIDGTVRLGGACPYVITAETDHWVVYTVYNGKGAFIDEKALPRDRFDEEFERKE